MKAWGRFGTGGINKRMWDGANLGQGDEIRECGVVQMGSTGGERILSP